MPRPPKRHRDPRIPRMSQNANIRVNLDTGEGIQHYMHAHAWFWTDSQTHRCRREKSSAADATSPALRRHYNNDGRRAAGRGARSSQGQFAEAGLPIGRQPETTAILRKSTTSIGTRAGGTVDTTGRVRWNQWNSLDRSEIQRTGADFATITDVRYLISRVVTTGGYIRHQS
ncbi:hypothetical protein C8R44DRAFT_736625 [Mycena epipterygia]|nr:hypothetical protein C8R44DRAFT_736625 [Mycena epipterygia]